MRLGLDKICAQKWDLLVVGGGINGAAIARDAALRGLKTLLIEKEDFAFGTSSRSTKLIHGGLRYLEHGEYALVKESLAERWLLTQRLAPHLVKPRSILFPVSKGDKRPGWMIRAGLWIYDILAGKRNIQKHRWLNKKKALQAEPALNAQSLESAGLFWDCQMNDARLCLENVLDAQEAGAICLNRCALESVHGKELGDIRARVRDLEKGSEGEVRAGILVNAAGPWVDKVLQSAGMQLPPLLKLSKGIHLVTKPLTQNHAILAPALEDNRVFFVIPWKVEGKDFSMVGTTEGDFNGDLDHVRAESDEIAYLIKETQRILPSSLSQPSDVVATYAGLRPLAAPAAGVMGHFKVSREAVLTLNQGLLSVTGGKFTSYRSLAQRAVDRCIQELNLKAKDCETSQRPLPGAGQAQLAGAQPILADYLRSIYGSRAEEVWQLCLETPALKEAIYPACQTIYAQAVFAARHEMALSLTDFYLRRTFLGLAAPPDHAGASKVAALMAKELNWTHSREAKELEKLRRQIAGEYR